MKRPHYALLVVLIVILTYFLRRQPSQPQPQPSNPTSQSPSADIPTANTPTGQQNFDFYLLNLSWSPEFCHSHPDKPECAQHLGFVLHGLWPQNTIGRYPEHCSDDPGPQNPSAYSDLYPDPGLLHHEWQTHGTCSGLAPDAFFNLARQALHSVIIPTELTTLTQQTSMPPADILGLFARSNPSFPPDSLALSCGNNYLTAIEVCMSKTLQPISCGALRSCRANTVRIAPPQN
jgi:ribonuclease T2